MSDFWAQVATLARSLERRSYYTLLEVTDDSGPDDVRAAYARLVAIYHPDRHARETDPERRRALVSIQARLNEAYRALVDPTKRGAYDRGLAEGKLRLADGPAVGRASSISLVSPRARTFYEAGQDCERAGDLAGARMQYGLAIQVDPESIPIREAIARLTEPPPPPEPEPLSVPPARKIAAPPSDFVREDTRHPFARPVKLRCTSWEQVITMHARNLSRGGIFVKTASPLELGTLLDVQLGLPDGRTLTLEAAVARVVAPERDGDEPSGMALRFLPMDDERKAAFDEALRDAAAHAGRPATPPTAVRPAPRAASSDPIEEATLREVLADVARLREAHRHDILGVRADADAATIRAAFARLAKRHHPDLFVRYRSPLVVDAAIDAFAIVRQAYEHMRAEADARASAPSAPAPDAGTPARPLLAEELFSDRIDPPTHAPAAGSATELAAHGRAALEAGRFAEAREMLGQAAHLDPRDRLLGAAFHLASGYEARAAGRASEALDHFETALVFDKTCEEAIRALRAAASGGKRS